MSNLFLHFGLDPDKAKQMRPSDIKMIFDSKAFQDWKKAREIPNKMDNAICDRLDVLIKAIGNLGKVLAAR